MQAVETDIQALLNAAPMPMGILEVAPDDVVMVAINEATARQFGKPVADLVGLSVTQLGFPAWSLQIWREKCLESQRLGTTVKVEYERGGERISGQVGPLGTGPTGLPRFVYFKELIPPNPADESRRRIEERFRVAFEFAPIGMAISDRTGRWVAVNPALAAMTGYTQEELLERGFRGVSHPGDLSSTSGIHEAIIAGNTNTAEIEKRYIHKSGREVWVLVSVATIRDAEGNVENFIAQVTDTTERRRNEKALVDSVNRFRSLTALAPAGIFQTDAAGDCVYVNERWCGLSGLTPEQAKGRGWVAALHPEERDRITAEWYRAAQAGREFSTECRFQRPDGTVSWMAAAATAMRDAVGNVVGYLGSNADITDLKNAEERLRRSLEQQKAIVQREEALLRELDHRVRNNLAGLLGLVTLYERSDRAGREVAAAIRGKLRAMVDVHDLISRGHGVPISLSELIERVGNQLKADEGWTRVVARGPDVKVPPSQASPLAMILHELFTNSRKHGSLAAPAGSVRISWDLTGPELSLTWAEQGGPAVTAASSGVGLRLVDGFARSELRGACTRTFGDHGFLFNLRARLDAPATLPSQDLEVAAVTAANGEES